jgi:hypothetical protein
MGAKRKRVDQCANAERSPCGRRMSPSKEVDQLQARWLHALSCLMCHLTGQQDENSPDYYDAASAAWWHRGVGEDQKGAPVVLVESGQISSSSCLRRSLVSLRGGRDFSFRSDRL